MSDKDLSLLAATATGTGDNAGWAAQELGSYWFNRGDYASAIRWLILAASKPISPEQAGCVETVLGQAWMKIGAIDQARTCWIRAVTANRFDPLPAVLLSTSFQFQNWGAAFTWASFACATEPPGNAGVLWTFDRWMCLAVASWWLFGRPVPAGRIAVAMLTGSHPENDQVKVLVAQYEASEVR